MGAGNSTNKPNTSENNNNNNQNVNVNVNQSKDIISYQDKDYQEVFDKILYLSNSIFDSYQENFLSDEFCNKISLVYEKQIGKLNIKVLRDIQTAMNNKENNADLLLMLQHIPKDNNDKYFVDFFDELLNEHFYKKGIKYKKSVLEFEHVKLDKVGDSFDSDIPYIDFFHVNKLLKKLNNNNQTGGDNLNKFQQKLEKSLLTNPNNNNNNNEVNTQSQEQAVENINNLLTSVNQTGNLPNSLSTLNQQTNNSRFNSSRNTPSNKLNTLIKNNASSLNNNESRNQTNQSSTQNQNQNQNQNKNKNKNNEPREQNQNKNKNNHPRQQQNESNQQNQTRQQQNQNRQQQNQNRQQQQNQTKQQQQNQTRQQQQNQTRQQQQNQTKQQQQNQNKNKNKNNEPKQKMRPKYSVPRSFQEPESFCEKSAEGKCLMTKKSICKSIAQNFIIRDNIIAAILTTIPKIKVKDGKTIYEGGIAFQKFLNLQKCEVCVPLNYKELAKKEDLSEIVTSLLSKSKHLDQSSCAKNNGYFIKLVEEEQRIFVEVERKVKNNKGVLEGNPRWESNQLYMKAMNDLKVKYFESLNFLIAILEKLKNEPFVSNTVLNQIAMETKNIIDNLYNYTNFYYIYGTILLIQSEYKLQGNPALNQITKIKNVINK